MYLIDGRAWNPADPGYADALASAYERCLQPLCMCQRTPMYLARTASGHVVKRMPYSAGSHSVDCPHYEPSGEWSGRGQLMGTAIREDVETGLIQLRLAFPMSKGPARTVQPGADTARRSLTANGRRLSLRALLHYLWDEAQLTQWRPRFAGRRPWAVVRNRILVAAHDKIVNGTTLTKALYVPEAFAIEQRQAIKARRIAHWRHAAPGRLWHVQPLMILIGELKEVSAARFGHRLRIKHLPDDGFVVDDVLHGRMGRHFANELTLWAASKATRMIVAATFELNGPGVPVIDEISLMPVDAQWIPVADAYETQLIDRLVAEGRSFAKLLDYDVRSRHFEASAILLDAGPVPIALYVDQVNTQALVGAGRPCQELERHWFWAADRQDMPDLPLPVSELRAVSDCEAQGRSIGTPRRTVPLA
jgi:hypothetical protein